MPRTPDRRRSTWWPARARRRRRARGRSRGRGARARACAAPPAARGCASSRTRAGCALLPACDRRQDRTLLELATQRAGRLLEAELARAITLLAARPRGGAAVPVGREHEEEASFDRHRDILTAPSSVFHGSFGRSALTLARTFPTRCVLRSDHPADHVPRPNDDFRRSWPGPTYDRMGMSRPPDRLHTDETETAEVAGETPVTAVEPRGPRARPVTPALAVAGRVDRFLILEKLGEGGMGAVYVAYDTLLDRKVAMKVVRPDRRSSMGGISPRERLLREAQAMARLSHPNVVAVLEVGELDDDVYLALELVEGTTLKAWMRAQRRPWPEVIAHFVAAGRGLAAAHEAGLVHRDFKPDNVLIGSDGRVRVADFGVVSMSHGQRESSSSPSPGVEPDASGASDAFTFSGMRVGTPAYMPPEQYEGEAVDARADQFSFCVALWEALYGERPFPPLAPDASGSTPGDGELDDSRWPWLMLTTPKSAT
ncbi:MAG: serine/threonine protein kinase, partial [Kofleriaceae bacterium]